MFDLAVASELAGDLESALASYREVVKRTAGKDQLAVEGAKQVERVLLRCKDSPR